MKPTRKKSAPAKRSAKILELDRQVAHARAASESARRRARTVKAESKRVRKALKLAKKAAKEARKKFKALKRALNEAIIAATKPHAGTAKKKAGRKSTATRTIRRITRPKVAPPAEPVPAPTDPV
jgi:predicted  nucleic acid-binding Zn-ribbon protein